MRRFLVPMLLVLVLACSSDKEPPATPTSSPTSLPPSPTVAATSTEEPAAATPVVPVVAATQAPAALPAPPPPPCDYASPAEVAAGMQALNAKMTTASPTEQIAVRAALTQLDRNGDGLPDPMICRSTLQTALLVLSQPAPSLPNRP